MTMRSGGRHEDFSSAHVTSLADFVKYVGPTVKSERNFIGPIKPTSLDQMSGIVCDQLFLSTDIPSQSQFPRFSFVASHGFDFPVKA